MKYKTTVQASSLHVVESLVVRAITLLGLAIALSLSPCLFHLGFQIH